MDVSDIGEVWRKVPPEEKLELMAKAQAKGLSVAIVLIGVCATVSVGLQIRPLFWISMLIAPLAFQYAAGKSWRSLRPRCMLEYLGARSAARRYAFSSSSKDLTAQLIFRGEIVHQDDAGGVDEFIEYALQTTNDAAVWVTLFGDAVIVMAEGKGGADLKFGHITDERLSVITNESEEDNQHRIITIEYKPKRGGRAEKISLRSKYPGALYVFEKKLIGAIARAATTQAELVSNQESSSLLEDNLGKFDFDKETVY